MKNSKRHSILIAVQNSLDSERLVSLLSGSYEIDVALTLSASRFLLKDHNYSVVILDQKMSQCFDQKIDSLLKKQPSICKVLICESKNFQDSLEAVNNGEIHRFVSSPWQDINMVQVIAKACEKFELKKNIEEKNRKLLEANSELKKSNQKKTESLMVINHELKTPLTAISSFAQLLKETDIDPDQSLYLRHILENVDRLENLVENTVDFLSAQSESSSILNEEFDMGDIWKKVFSEPRVNQRLESRALSLEYRKQNISINTDKKILQLICRHLLDNATKFSPSNSMVRIGELLLRENQKETYQFFVSNEFFENQLSTVRKLVPTRQNTAFSPKGNVLNHSNNTGLGLAICNAHLKRLGGSLRHEIDGNRLISEVTINLGGDLSFGEINRLNGKKPKAYLFQKKCN